MRIKKIRNIRFLKEKAEQISNNKVFLDEISNLRQKWGMPPKGFIDDKDHGKWYEQFVQKADDFMDSAENIAEEKDLTNKYNSIRKDGYTYLDYLKDKEKLELKDPVNEYFHDIFLLRKKLNLSDLWTMFIEHYLLFNKITSPSRTPNVVFKKNQKTGELELYLRIWEETRKKDLLEEWPMIMSYQKRIAGHKKTTRAITTKNKERDAYIYQLYSSGTPVSEIGTKVYEKFIPSSDIIPDTEEEDFYNPSTDSIRKIIQRQRKRLGSK